MGRVRVNLRVIFLLRSFTLACTAKKNVYPAKRLDSLCYSSLTLPHLPASFSVSKASRIRVYRAQEKNTRPHLMSNMTGRNRTFQSSSLFLSTSARKSSNCSRRFSSRRRFDGTSPLTTQSPCARSWRVREIPRGESPDEISHTRGSECVGKWDRGELGEGPLSVMGSRA